MINKIQDFQSKQCQELFQTLNIKFGLNFLAVFDLKEQNLISLYNVRSFIVQDEQNRKTFFVKGKQVDLEGLIQGSSFDILNNNGGDLISKLESLPVVSHTYSENMFGFIGFGIQGY